MRSMSLFTYAENTTFKVIHEKQKSKSWAIADNRNTLENRAWWEIKKKGAGKW